MVWSCYGIAIVVTLTCHKRSHNELHDIVQKQQESLTSLVTSGERSHNKILSMHDRLRDLVEKQQESIIS